MVVKMKKSMIVKLIAMVLALMFLSGCSQQRSALQEQIAKVAADKKSVLLYVTDSNDLESSKYKEEFIATASEYSEYFSVIQADYGTDGESINKYLEQESMQPPAITLIAPNGARIKTFHVPVSIAEIMNARVTEAESEVLLSLQSDRIVILCVYVGELEAFQYVETKLSEALLTFSDRSSIHYLNPAAADDRRYIEKLSLPVDQSMIHVILPSGEIIEHYSLDTISSSDLTDLITKHSIIN
jgi:hypothetical protein